jgi:hypothetical protein
MSGRSGDPLDRLDVPLVWERTPAAAPQPAAPQPAERLPRRRPEAPAWGRMRLWVAALADLGVLLLALAAGWGVAAAAGATLTPAQLLPTAVAGALAAALIGVGSLWGWRGTPGMVLLRLRFADPLTLPQGQRVWLGWVLALVLLGVPLVVGARGRTGAELLAGSGMTLN